MEGGDLIKTGVIADNHHKAPILVVQFVSFYEFFSNKLGLNLEKVKSPQNQTVDLL